MQHTVNLIGKDGFCKCRHIPIHDKMGMVRHPLNYICIDLHRSASRSGVPKVEEQINLPRVLRPTHTSTISPRSHQGRCFFFVACAYRRNVHMRTLLFINGTHMLFHYSGGIILPWVAKLEF